MVQPNAFCVLCNLDGLEDTDHLFFSCPFAVSCWNKLGIHWNLQLDTSDWVLQAAQLFHTAFFMDFFIMAAWEIWNIRNSKIFDNGSPSLQLWVRRFKEQGFLQLVRVKEDLCLAFIQFLETVT